MITGHPKILIVKLSAIGDVVHTLPALTALRRRFPQAHIAWLVEEAAAPLIIGHRALDRVLIFRRKRWLKGVVSAHWRQNFSAMILFLRQLRDTRYDLVIDFQASLKGALPILAVRANRKVGFGPGMEHQEHSYLVLNERIPMVSMEMHALERGLKLLEAIGVPTGEPLYDLPIRPDDHRAAQTLLLSKRPAKQRIAINPVAKWETKLWPIENFAELADTLIERYEVAIFYTGDRGDNAVVEQIQTKMRHSSVNLAGRTSLLQLAALYQRMACVISTDTGPMHIAAAAGVPVVALFGPTAPWRTGPYGSRHGVLQADLSCGPCFKRRCATNLCMQSIGVADVLEAAHKILYTDPNGAS
jgi:heptosyltransferase I